MLSIASMKNDDASFLALTNRITDRLIQQVHPANVFLVRTDHWFDHKWLGFSGKVLGAVAISNNRLTIPPFVPNRVVSQEVYELNESTGSYGHTEAPLLHIVQTSKNNLTRFIDRLTKSGVFVWFSGDTQLTNTGSIMVYVVANDSQSSWYASFQRTGNWEIVKVSGLSKSELMHLADGLLPGQDA